MNSDLTPVKNFAYRHEAEHAQQILETAGIACAIRGDDASGWAPHIGLATGGVTLLVAQSDLEEAAKILAEAGGSS